MRNKFYGCYVVAPVAEFYGIAAGAGSYVGNFEGPFDSAQGPLSNRGDSLFDVMQGCAEFNLSVAGSEAVFFVEFVVVFLDICHGGGLRGLPLSERG